MGRNTDGRLMPCHGTSLQEKRDFVTEQYLRPFDPCYFSLKGMLQILYTRTRPTG
jgi:hypothetical protein